MFGVRVLECEGIEWFDGGWMGRQRCAGRLGGKAEFVGGLTVGEEHRGCAECLGFFVEGFLLTFVGGVVILRVHIWEHSGPFGYLIPIWLIVNMAGKSRGIV